MSRALLELLLRSLRGRIVQRLRLLRQPKYLLGLAAAVAYFAFLILPNAFEGLAGRARGPARGASWPAELGPAVHLVVGLVLALGVTVAWLLTSSKPLLRLTEPEVHLLLPAPLTRRQVLRFALLKQQPGILLGALVITFFRGGLAASPATGLLQLATTWAFLNLIDLHLKGVSFWKARVRELPPPAARRRIGLAVGVAVAYWAAVAVAVREIVLGAPGLAATIERASGLAAVMRSLAAAVRATFLDELLAPFVLLARTLVAGRAGSTLPDLPGLLLLAALLVASYLWVVRSGVRFEEAALERSRRQLTRRSRRQRFERLGAAARRRYPFPLATAGRPETAIFWKNLMLRGRMPLARGAGLTAAALAGLTALAAGATALGLPPALHWALSAAGLALLVALPLFSGLMLRNDLRVDLLEVELLRSWPLPGRRLVAAEMLAPATSALWIVLTGCGLVLASAAAARLGGDPTGGTFALLPEQLAGGAPPAAALAVALLGAVLVAMPISLVSIAIQNLAALLLPSWVPLGLERGRGTAALGQRILIGVVHLLGLAVGALPALLLVGGALALQAFAEIPFTVWELPLLALLAALPLLLEAWLLVRVAGAAWDRLDPSAELLAARE